MRKSAVCEKEEQNFLQKENSRWSEPLESPAKSRSLLFKKCGYFF